MKLLQIILFCLFSTYAVGQVNVVGNCHVAGDPNSISALNVMDSFSECAIVYDTVNHIVYKYVEGGTPIWQEIKADGAAIETNTVPSGGKAGDFAIHTNLGQFYINNSGTWNAQGFPDGDFAKTASLTTNADLTPNLSTGLRYTWSINGNYNLQNPTFGSIGRKGVIAVTNTAGTASTITTVGGNYVDENYATVSTIVIPASATKYLTFRQATDSGGPVVMLENVTIINPTMGGDLSGTASNAQIVANAVGTSEIADDAVTLAKQASGTANRLQVFDASGNPAQGTVTGNATLSAGVLNVTGGISNVDLYEQTLEASVTFQDSLKYEYDAFGELNVYQRIDAERAVRYYVGQASGGDDFRKLKQVEIVKTEKYANADSRTGTWTGYPGTSAWGATGAEIFYEFTGTGCYFNHFEDNRGGIWRFYLEQPLGNVIDSVDIDTYCAGAGCGAGINRQDLLFSGKPEGTYTIHGVNIPLWNPASTGENRGWASGYSTGNVVYRHEYTFVSIEWAEANSFVTETQLTATNSNQEFAFNCRPTDSGLPFQWIPSHGEVTTAFFGDSLKLYVDFIEPAISPTIHSPYRAGKKIVLEQQFLGLHDMQADSLCTASTKTVFDNKEVEFYGNFTWTDTVDVSGYGHMLPVFEDWGDVLQTDQGQFSDLDIISGAQETVTNLSGKVRTFRAYNDAQDYFITAKILDDNTFRIQDGFQGAQFIDHRNDGITQKFYSEAYNGSVVYPGDTYANHFKLAVGVPATNFSSPLTKAYGDILNGGNSGAITIGTNDDNNFILERNNVAAVTIGSGGSLTANAYTSSGAFPGTTSHFVTQNSSGQLLTKSASTFRSELSVGTIANGGTGLTALGTANQLLRVNAGATALEYFTPSYITSETNLFTPGGLTNTAFVTHTDNFGFEITGTGAKRLYTTNGTYNNSLIINSTAAVVTGNDGTNTANLNALANGNLVLNSSTGNYLIDTAPDTDTDAAGNVLLRNGSGFVNQVNRAAFEVLTGSGAPVNGTTTAYEVGQIYIDVTNAANPISYYASTKSTDPDAAATGSVWNRLTNSTVLADADGDTKVQVEESTDEDIIRFDAAGNEVALFYDNRIDLLRRPLITGAGAINTKSAAQATITNSSNTQYATFFVDDANGDLSIYTNGTTTPQLLIESTGTGIGINTTNADASAALDITSTTQGVLFPRMTTTQRDAITTPAAGLVIFNTTTDKLQVRTSTTWVDLH